MGTVSAVKKKVKKKKSLFV